MLEWKGEWRARYNEVHSMEKRHGYARNGDVKRDAVKEHDSQMPVMDRES